MVRKPPHILITTPESLGLLLSSKKFRDHFRQTRYIILDEIHDLANNKRGTHLSLSVERLADIMESPNTLSQRSFIITTYALCGFANFVSIAIIIGGIGSIAPKRRGDLSRMGVQSLIGGTFATMLTGTVVGFFL